MAHVHLAVKMPLKRVSRGAYIDFLKEGEILHYVVEDGKVIEKKFSPRLGRPHYACVMDQSSMHPLLAEMGVVAVIALEPARVFFLDRNFQIATNEYGPDPGEVKTSSKAVSQTSPQKTLL